MTCMSNSDQQPVDHQLKKVEFTVEDVQKLASLSRLALTDEEKIAFADELGGILGYVSQIQDVVASGVFDRTASAQYQHKNVMRDDVSSDMTPDTQLNPDPSILVDSAPRHTEGYVQVKKILGGSQ